MKSKFHFTYIIECLDGTYYTGYTTDPLRRYEEHSSSYKGSKYMKQHPPKRIAYLTFFLTRSAATKLEAQIKSMSHSNKKSLILEHADHTAHILKSLIETPEEYC